MNEYDCAFVKRYLENNIDFIGALGKMKKKFSVLVTILLLLALLVGCTLHDGNTVVSVTYGTAPDAPIAIHTDRQYTYLKKALSLDSAVYADGLKEMSKPADITLKWNAADVSDYTVRISEKQDMSDAVCYNTALNSLELTNFKLATTYYWSVETNGVTGDVSSFVTDGACPRNLSVDGVTNVRDLGGWEIANGKKITQGLIYRSGRLNESSAVIPNIEITENGKRAMLETLGIKSEIDLRMVDGGEIGGITSSPLGQDVNYFNCPMEWDGNIWLDNKEEIIRMFSILADFDNYPLVFHCNIGTDRTGMMAFLINALLGVSEKDLLVDYMFSNLGKIGGMRQKSGVTQSPYYKAVKSASGNCLSEKTYNALVSIGVEKSHLDSVVRIMTAA